MNPENPHQESPENKNFGSKILEILKRTGESIMKVLDAPFEWYAKNQVKPLLELDPNPKERGMIEESIRGKYIPATRNSIIAAGLGVPGIVTSPDAATIMIILTAVFTTTGVAWFTMSLKEVKEKFSPFGTQLTSYMLQAFLSTLLMTVISAGYTLASPEIQAIFNWATEAGVKLEMPNGLGIVAAKTGTLLSGSFAIKRLVSAVIKFDANDAMLTGSSDAAKKFFEKSISTLRDASRILKDKHSLESANLQIGTALNDYYEYLLEIKAPIPTELDPEILQKLISNPCMKQDKFDTKLVPMLKSCIAQFKEFISETKPAEIHRFKTSMDMICNLEQQYQNDNAPKQELADAMIATTFDNLASLMELFQDNLVALKKSAAA